MAFAGSIHQSINVPDMLRRSFQNIFTAPRVAKSLPASLPAAAATFAAGTLIISLNPDLQQACEQPATISPSFQSTNPLSLYQNYQAHCEKLYCWIQIHAIYISDMHCCEQFFGESTIGGPEGASGILERLASAALGNRNQRLIQRLSTSCSFNGHGELHRHALDRNINVTMTVDFRAAEFLTTCFNRIHSLLNKLYASFMFVDVVFVIPASSQRP
jgi:hypothetical protein